MGWAIKPRTQHEIEKANKAYLQSWDKYINVLIKRKKERA